MAELRFEVPFPAEQRQEVSDIIHRNAWLLPRWVEVIWIRFETPNQPTISSRVRVIEEYRSVRLSVCPEWLLSEDHIRESDIRHEFIHVATDPMHRVALQLIDLLDDGKLKDWAKEELRLAVERSTADLEYAIQRGLER